MNDKALTQEKFEAMKLIISAKHTGDLHKEAMAKLTYAEYLIMRQELVNREKTYPAVCFNGVSHKVYAVVQERYSIDSITGAEESIDIDDEYVECPECRGKGQYCIAYTGDWEEAEMLVEPAQIRYAPVN